MPRKNDIKIELDWRILSTRLFYCECTKCINNISHKGYNNDGPDCRLKSIVIDYDGKCSNYEKERDYSDPNT